RAPARAEISWRKYQPDLRVESVIDVTLREGQPSVLQRITLHSPENPFETVRLAIPPSLREHLRVLAGGSLGPRGVVKLERTAKTATLVLAYALPVPREIEETAQVAVRGKRDSGRLLAVPFLRLVDATRTETKVRVWGETPVHVVLA